LEDFGTEIFVGATLEVTVERMASGGQAVARHNGFVLFFYYGAPGDICRIQVDRQHKRYGEATLLEVLKPGERRLPHCPYFGSCGGCQWQHLPYLEQLRQKSQILQHALQKVNIPARSSDVIASPKEFHYRNRIQLHSINKKVGFHSLRSNQLVEIDQCAIADPQINDWMKQDSNKKLPDRFELFLDEDGHLHESFNTPRGRSLKRFSQINQEVNSLLVDWVVKKALGAQKIWDLYAGAGNFSLVLAKQTGDAEVLAVESSAYNVRTGHKLAQSAKLDSRVRFECSRVERFLKHTRLECPELALLDPPREGLSPQVKQMLLKMRIKRLILIGCDVANFARDLSSLTEVYELLEVKAFDMFPQTHHLESAGYLELKQSAF